MTVIAAVVTDKAIHIGTDCQVAWGMNFVRPINQGKFIDVADKDTVVAFCGNCRFEDIFQNMVREKEHSHLFPIKRRKDVVALASLFYECVKENGAGDAVDDCLPHHSFAFIVVSSYTKSIWVIEGDYSVTAYLDYVSHGSGSIVCESALYALGLVKISGLRALKVGLQAACDRTPFCDGPLYYKKLTLK